MNHIAEMLRSSVRTSGQRRVGVEIERLGMWTDGTTFLYQDQNKNGEKRPGAETLLRQLSANTQWPVVDGFPGRPIGLNCPFGKVSLEPGSQLEFSSEPLCDLFAVQEQVKKFEAEVDRVTVPWNLKWLGIGVNPIASVDEIDIIPAKRYHIMTDYFPSRGKLGTSMMRLTTSLQINLDYTSEDEGIEMLRAALLAAPVSYALFGNSPFSRGKIAENSLSFRGSIWQDTDPSRSGMLEEAFRPGFNFDSYAQIIWKQPLMFASNTKGEYVAADGKRLEDISRGAMPGVETDETNQWAGIRELFTEARLKPGYVEIRSIDGQTTEMRYAAVAFWMGLLYFPEGRKLFLKELGCFPEGERSVFLRSAIRDGLQARLGSCSLKRIAERALELSEEGLERRGLGEGQFLKPVKAVVESGVNPAQQLLTHFKGDWNGDFSKVIDYCSRSR